MLNHDKTITVPAFNGSQGGKVEFATNDKSTHLNMHLNFNAWSETNACMQLTPYAARQMRDHLLKLYPLNDLTPPFFEEVAAELSQPPVAMNRKYRVTNSIGFEGSSFARRSDALENAKKRAEGSPGTSFLIWSTEAKIVCKAVTTTELQVTNL